MCDDCKHFSKRNDDDTRSEDLVSSGIDDDSVKGFVFAVVGCLLVLVCAIVWHFLFNQ